MKKILFAHLVTIILVVLTAACQPESPIDVPPGDGDYVYGQEATVETLEVLLMERFPVQARAIVTGYLPDGCTELHAIEVEQREQVFELTLVTRRPSGDVACTMALEPFEDSVDLEIEGMPAGTYRVTAQDQEATFTLDVDNVLSDLEPNVGDDIVLTNDAVVEDISMMIMESYPVQVSVRLSGYLPDGCTTIHEVRSERDGDTFTVQIITQRPGGDVACTMAIVPFEETVPLEVEGLPAGEYSVQVGELSEEFTLDVDN